MSRREAGVPVDNDPASLELLGRDVLSQLRDVEAADPRRVRRVPAARGLPSRMSSQALSRAAPELAQFGAERLHDRVAYLGTLKPDGSPRLHPVRPVIAGGRLFVFMELTSPKVGDLERDPRYSLHCTARGEEPWDLREFVAEGYARRVDDAATRATAVAGSAFPRDERFVLFELAVDAAASTVYGGDDRPTRERWRAI